MGGVATVGETTPLNNAVVNGGNPLYTGNNNPLYSESKHQKSNNSAASCIDRYFLISQRGSTLKRELIAGCINFVANSYLLVLMPKILAMGGVDERVAVTAFVLSTALGSFLVGLTANLPVPVGPGLGCAAYFAYGLTGSQATTNITSTQFGITCCFLAGAAMLVLGLVDVPRRIFGVVPKSVKDAMPIGLGMLLSLCGFQQMKLVVSDPYTGVKMSTTITASVILGSAGAVSMAYLSHRGWEFTKFVLPIAFFTLISWIFHLSPWPEGMATVPTLGSVLISFKTLGRFFWSPVFGLFMICMFDIGGIVESVCGFADALDKSKKKNDDQKPLITHNGIRGEYWVYVSCGAASLLAAALGGTPVIAFGESFAGVEIGGRTGLTSITSSVCFLLSLPFEPIFRAVPLYASAPVLVLLGVILLKLTKGLQLQRMFTAFPSFCTIALMPYLYSIDKAIWAGLISWTLMTLLDKLWLVFAGDKNKEDEVSKDDLVRQVETILVRLEKLKGTLMVNGDMPEHPQVAPAIDDMLTSAGEIVRIAEEELDDYATRILGDKGDGTRLKTRSMSAIQVMLTPVIKYKHNGDDEKGPSFSPIGHNDHNMEHGSAAMYPILGDELNSLNAGNKN
mmetsp:Transcript_2117/g.3868  ORF Transcript_2117/g.3868 Transcript_2117/m.3868 type:complete len:622 (-) Transcript_2117:466-2331(-)|eukprot:CAMPEP_0197521358 /NCGR_PEP_ID=MMETSP1318-20131121/6623_1 /TAXON_ID=552666 /ORGANISM="Partenskyella glossopodia, Strain RCC365" /LENGTH=621 /DNA_ID=CAMNT_0043073305 /DNA_START=177 /DNA_END=2042 /DNA_ORIENTATION=-